jgi:tetratricopeptide (TPR) repeat protein
MADALGGSGVNPLLLAAAFGDDPGRWPLPVATTPYDRWLRAVAAGGQGRYGSATAELAAVRRQARNGALASLAHSTIGSFARQLGGHSEARRWDGRALALAASDPEAAVDALLGLAADALGMRRLVASAALLDRARATLEGSAGPARLPLRWQWVAAELAMARGDGDEAVRRAERAGELAAAQPSARHVVKTQVIHAAALCCVGRIADARAAADDALTASGALGLIPLRWAASSLLVDIGSNTAQLDGLTAIRDACADTIRRAGGVWRR